MGMNYTDEEYHQMTIDEIFEVDVKPSLFAVSRIFADCRKQMTLSEYKTLVYALQNVDWTQPCPDTLYLDKKKLASLVGINSDPDHLSADLNRSIGEMPNHSFLRFKDPKNGIYDNGNFVRRVTFFRNKVRIRLEDEYLKLFGDLDRDYITMWSGDIFQMTSERAILFYELLRNNSDTRNTINIGTVGIKKFKEMFNIPKDGKGSYMREKGGFNRFEFERKVIDPICEELSKTEMITLILQPDGKYYEKVKSGNKVISYRFYWTLSDPKPRLEVEVPEKEDIIDMIEPTELWMSALKDFNFSDEELSAIESRLILVPQWNMFSNNAAYGSLDLDRYHFMDMRAKDIKAEDKRKPIKNKYKYLIKMLENDYIPKGE